MEVENASDTAPAKPDWKCLRRGADYYGLSMEVVVVRER